MTLFLLLAVGKGMLIYLLIQNVKPFIYRVSAQSTQKAASDSNSSRWQDREPGNHVNHCALHVSSTQPDLC